MSGKTQRRPSKQRPTTHSTTKNVGPQRFVSALKVFVNDAEKELLQSRAQGFNSVSNYIRHHLGLSLNETGRKRKIVVAAFSVAEWDLGEEMEPPASVVTQPLVPAPVPPAFTPSPKMPAHEITAPLLQANLFD